MNKNQFKSPIIEKKKVCKRTGSNKKCLIKSSNRLHLFRRYSVLYRL